MTITKIPGNVDEASAHLVLDRHQPILIRRRQVVVVVVVVVVWWWPGIINTARGE